MSHYGMRKYTIEIKGKIVGHYMSDKDYNEFEKPFFEKYPQYKVVIKWFDHVKLIISDIEPE